MNGHDTERVDCLGKSPDDVVLDAINALPPEARLLMCDALRDAVTDAPRFRIVDGVAERADD